MRRIEIPEWAQDRGEVELAGGLPAEQAAAIQQHRPAILDLVQREVEKYVTENSWVDSFPDPNVLNGEYYIGGEWYNKRTRPVWYQLCFRVRCLQKALPPYPEPVDYLGLDVWVRCDPKTMTFTFLHIDSSSI
jgi:hypothetical protein